MIVENDSFLAEVTIPPLVLGLEVCSGVVGAGLVGLPRAGGSVDPDATSGISLNRLLVGDPVGVESLLNADVVS